MARIYTNFAKSTLLSSIAAGDLALTVAAGDGALFPAAGAGSTFDAVIYNTSGQREIVSVTAVSSDTFTIVRAQQGTLALAWNAGDRIGHRLTAAALNSILFADDMQEETPVYCGTAGGTANALTLTPSPAITGYVAGQRFRFKAALSSSGTATVNVSAQGNKDVQLHYAALVGGEITINKLYEIVYDGTNFQLVLITDEARAIQSNTEDTTPDLIADFVGTYDTSAATGKKARLANVLGLAAPPGQGVLLNGLVVPSVAANALTVAVKGADGNDPSASNPVFVAFRSATAATGGFTVRKITAALSVVVSSGSTLGHASARACTAFVYLIDNGGTVELAVSSVPFDLAGTFGNTRLISTTAEGGAGAADSATGIYSTTARSNVPWVCVAMLKSNQTTAGTWAANMTQVEQAPFDIQKYTFRASRSTNQTGVANATWTKYSTDTEAFDLGGAFNNSSARYECEVGGPHTFYFNQRAENPIDGMRSYCAIYVNGSQNSYSGIVECGTTGGATVSTTTTLNLNTGDYVEAYVYHDRGTNEDFTGSSLMAFSGWRH